MYIIYRIYICKLYIIHIYRFLHMYIHTSYVHTSVHAIINAYKTNVLLCPSHNTQTGKKTRMRTK